MTNRRDAAARVGAVRWKGHRAEGLAPTSPRLTEAAFCAAHGRRSDQRRNGTQDVNDPVYGPATRSAGRGGRTRPGFRVCDDRRLDQRPFDAHVRPRIRLDQRTEVRTRSVSNVAMLNTSKRANWSVGKMTDADAPTRNLAGALARVKAALLASALRGLDAPQGSRLFGIYGASEE